MDNDIVCDNDIIDYNMIGKRIRQKRKERKLTQEDLANIIDMNTESINKIENGKSKPGLRTIAKICVALSCPIEYIVAGTVKNSSDYMFAELSQYTADERGLMCDMMELVNKYVESKENAKNKKEPWLRY